ncbi:PspA/IM30 family protein [Paracidobacterium acidisoli]|uniref:PspA/IM30 family protein n=1 Tax=Paracidobacterium acidisoli TaxID=2303751 RepID=A0A372IJA7_9BACT|nr:PspA/IM30 family protein [Paracidobacterium acidisoli]MBT9333207.1 PspA/IM30 family protein [Paracidobacterium acidisoli]
MALLERVGTLLRANLNDLIEKAEDPEKLLKQLVLDMENQLLQVKTQVAIAIADEHLLDKKRKEHEEAAAEWQRKAELAVKKANDDLARAALERSLSHKQMAAGFAQQLEDQKAEVETLKNALRRLQQKLEETRSRCEMLIAQHRRARVVGRAAQARQAIDNKDRAAGMQRMRVRIAGSEASNAAHEELADADTLEDRFAVLEREEQIEALLRDLKEQHGRDAAV